MQSYTQTFTKITTAGVIIFLLCSCFLGANAATMATTKNSVKTCNMNKTIAPLNGDFTTLSVEPQQHTVYPATQFSVNVTIDPTSPVEGIGYEITFDPALISAVEVTEGDFLMQAYDSTIFVPLINNSLGYVRVITCKGPGQGQPGASNPATSASILFETKHAAGTTELAIGKVSVYPAVDITTINGSVTVEVPPTPIAIDPSNQTVTPGETFTVDVHVTPSIPIRGFQFEVRYDAAVLEAVRVVEGTLFSNYSTYFNNGTITPGYVGSVYGVILGQGGVGTPGVLARIMFSAKTTPGTTSVDLLNVKLADVHSHAVPLQIVNGSITVAEEHENQPPHSPRRPSGPVNIEENQVSSYSTSADDPEGDRVQYRFDWDANGDGDISGWTPLGTAGHTRSVSHSWESPGTYIIKTQARDEHGAQSGWSSGLTVVVTRVNHPPNTPHIPSGPTMRGVDEDGTYSTRTVDPDDDKIQYLFDWGDGTSDWTSFVNSNQSVSLDHAWNTPGNYTIRVKAQDEKGAESAYSSTITVNVVENQPDLACSGNLQWTEVTPGETVTGGFTVRNTGDSDSMLDWEIASYPSWGTWTFTPTNGTNLTPADGTFTVEVNVVAPTDKNTGFGGHVEIINAADSTDSCIIPVSLSTPKNTASSASVFDFFAAFTRDQPHWFSLF